MNITELVAQCRAAVNTSTAREARAKAELQSILDLAKTQRRPNMTDAESRRADELFAEVDSARAEQADGKAKLDRALAIEAEESELAERAAGTRPLAPAPDRSTTMTSMTVNEQRTYNKGNDPTGANFLRDVLSAHYRQDAEAWNRLNRHMTEERVERGPYLERASSSTTSTFGGMVVPQYLVDMTAPVARSRRPFADAVCNRHVLPAAGMTFTIPRFTTGASAALQASELTGVSDTQMVESDLSIAVKTAAGMQLVSRQAIDRGTGVDDFTLQDLMTAYASSLDSELLNGAGTGLSAKALGTLGAFSDTQPTGAKLYPKILAAQSGVEAVVLGANASHVVMHSRRWAWLSKEMTSTWPLINSQGIPPQAGGTARPVDYAAGVRGMLPNGLAVVVDNNIKTDISTSQDEIYVVPGEECHLWEDPTAPAFIRAEQPSAASLGVLLVVYGYFAYTYDRYGSGSMQKVGGTGLTTPAW